MIHVLVWPSSNEGGREVIRSLSHQREIVVHEASSEQDSPHCVGSVTDPQNNWPLDLGKAVETICKELEPDDKFLVYPTHDEVLKVLSKVNLMALAPNLIWHGVETTWLCLSKIATYNKLRSIVPCPDVLSDNRWPSYVKEDFGYGGKGSHFCHDALEETSVIQRLAGKSHVVCEYLPGPEYTIDCFSQNGQLLWSRARTREKIKAGMSTLTKRVSLSDSWRDPDWLNDWPHAINSAIKFNGAWYFQVKERADGTIVLLEVAPRIAGGCALARVNGVNLPLLSVYAALGKEVRIIDTGRVKQMERPLRNDYSLRKHNQVIWVDVDDTLHSNGVFNSELIGLLVKLHLDGNAINFATRSSDYDVIRAAEEVCRPRMVWTLKDGQKKSERIKREHILIDDSFAEREEVFKATGAMVLDVPSALELLG